MIKDSTRSIMEPVMMIMMTVVQLFILIVPCKLGFNVVFVGTVPVIIAYLVVPVVPLSWRQYCCDIVKTVRLLRHHDLNIILVVSARQF
jgi:hypothetical protein